MSQPARDGSDETARLSDSSATQQELEDYLLLILSDSALPTGGFVASSGLESFVQHGFINSASTSSSRTKNAVHPSSSTFTLLSFLRESLASYAHLNLPFFDRAHAAVWNLHAVSDASNPSQIVADALQSLIRLDKELEAMLLNQVTRRASKAQGMALLTLYSRAFATTPGSAAQDSIPSAQKSINTLMEDLKAACRGRKATFHGHLPTCFATLCAALGLSLDRARQLHLFLQARAILSSAVRLNLVGPYAAQRVLLVDVRSTARDVLKAEHTRRISSHMHTKFAMGSRQQYDSDDEDETGPATTWPLGEILAARHDQLHSRIFNS